jgi:hypothetical protein
MIKLFVRFLALLLLLGLSVAGIAAGVRTPVGAKAVSRGLTSQLRQAAPGTHVDLEKLKLHWPPALTAEQGGWIDSGGRPILRLTSVRAALTRFRFPPGRTGWKVQTQIRKLDLAALDRVIAGGEWRSDGFLNGEVRLYGGEGRLQDLELDLQSEEPGGNLNSEVLERLAEMLPAGDARGMLLKALGAKATFHFDTGLLEMRTEGEDYLLNLLLNGDHLLDLKIRIEKELWNF